MRPRQIRELLDSLGPALRLFAAQWCRSPDDAVQEAFIDLIDAPAWPENPRAWLHAVTRNKAKNIGRAEQRRAHCQRTISEQTAATWLSPADDPSPFNVTELRAALEDLDPDDRQIVVARVWGEMKLDDLAEMVGCSTSAVHRRYHAAIEKLRLKLEVENATDR